GLLGGDVAPPETPRPLGPVVRRSTGDLAHQVAADEPRRVLRLLHQALGVEIAAREDRFLRAVVAEVADERARGDPLDARNAVSREVAPEALVGAPGGRRFAILADDEGADERASRLDVLLVHADVPDLGIRHGDELPLVRRIREDLLVARHARVEDDLADGFAGGAEGAPTEDGPVRERQDGRG